MIKQLKESEWVVHIVDPQITTRAYKLFELNIAHYLITIIGLYTPNWWVLKYRNSFQVPLLLHSPPVNKKQKAPQVNANESVKIPIRIKKLYNHNGEPSSRGELSKKNIEKTLNKKILRRKIKGVAGLRSLFRYIYYRHHKIIIYYTMFLLCPIVCVCLLLWGVFIKEARKTEKRQRLWSAMCYAKRRDDIVAYRAKVSAEK